MLHVTLGYSGPLSVGHCNKPNNEFSTIEHANNVATNVLNSIENESCSQNSSDDNRVRACLKQFFLRHYRPLNIPKLELVADKFEWYLKDRQNRQKSLSPLTLTKFFRELPTTKKVINKNSTSIKNRFIEEDLTQAELIEQLFTHFAQCPDITKPQLTAWFESLNFKNSAIKAEYTDPSSFNEFDITHYTRDQIAGLAGQSGASVVKLTKDGKVYFLKYSESDPNGTEAQREYASYELSRSLGFSMVPKTELYRFRVEKRMDDRTETQFVVATLQEGVDVANYEQGDGTTLDKEKKKELLKNTPASSNLFLFDYLIGHRDRHSGNVFVPKPGTAKKSTRLIDNGGSDGFDSFQNEFFPSNYGNKISGGDFPDVSLLESNTTNRLKRIKYPTLKSALRNLKDEEIEGVWLRLQVIKGEIENHESQKGTRTKNLSPTSVTEDLEF